MTGDRWLTYNDAASALGMTPESIRQRARREHWRKQLGNDGKALILVPIDTARIPGGDTPDDVVFSNTDTPVSRPVKRPEPDALATALQARIVEMERHAVQLRADLELERLERTKERDRAEHLVGEVADLARQLAWIVGEAGERERSLLASLASAEVTKNETIAAQGRAEADVVRARDELAEWKARPWWRKLAS